MSTGGVHIGPPLLIHDHPRVLKAAIVVNLGSTGYNLTYSTWDFVDWINVFCIGILLTAGEWLRRRQVERDDDHEESIEVLRATLAKTEHALSKREQAHNETYRQLQYALNRSDYYKFKRKY